MSLADDRPVWASGLVKSFGKSQAVKRVSLSVPKGSIYGVLGPNGAGKTTTLRMLLGIIDPDRGERCLLGEAHPRNASRRVGYLPEERGLYPSMKAREAIAFMGALRELDWAEGRKRADAALEAVFVGGAGNDTYYDRSGTNVIKYTGLHTYAGQYPIFIPVSITDGPSADVMTVNKGSLGKDTVSVDRIVLTTLDDTVTLSKNTVTTSITIDGGEGSETLFLKDSAYSEVSSLYLRGASNPVFNIMISKDSYSPYSDPSLYCGESAGFKNFEKLSAERMNIITDGKMGFTNSINGNISPASDEQRATYRAPGCTGI